MANAAVNIVPRHIAVTMDGNGRWAAARYTQLTFDKVLMDKLKVMDTTAVVMCRDNHLPLRVFNLNNPGDLTRLVRGEDVGTLVTFE
jgi:uridylate kinase